jgi:hypothetical protein
MRTSLFAAPIALALALSPLGCAEDEEPEVLHEPGVTYESLEGNYTFELETEEEWPLIVNQNRPFAIAIKINPWPLPDPNPGGVTVDFEPLQFGPGDIADKQPEITPDPSGDKFLLNYTFEDAGYYVQEMTITGPDGKKDRCVVNYKIRDRV